MRLAVLELSARFGDPGAATEEARRLLAGAACDLALLPEASLTGYVSPDGDFDLSRFAEPEASSTQIDALRGLARDAGCAVAGPVIESEGARAYNAFFVLAPNGDVLARYRKRHPWYPETWASPGRSSHSMFEIAGITCTIAICFDVHFLEDEAKTELASSDLLLFPSAWVDDQPADGRAPILERLAERFDIVVANANWGPGTPSIRGQGSSRVVSPSGKTTFAKGGLGRLDLDLSAKP